MAKTLVVVAGPTGIGKSTLAIQIAEYFKCEIISCDSRQIFKELTIGTAIPSTSELRKVKHHFIHSHSVFDNYNASRYETEAIESIEQQFNENDLILLVGGSMLYIDAICKGIDIMPDADSEIRENLKNEFENNGIESLRIQLKKLDPQYYTTVDLKNHVRLIHALEICLTTGKPYSSFLTNPLKKRSFSILKIGLDCDRKELHNRINKRVDVMIKSGLEKEARLLYPHKNLTALNTVGYKELFSFFEGNISFAQAVELIKRNSRRYARKQLTWFRSDSEMNWFQPNQKNEIIEFIEKSI